MSHIAKFNLSLNNEQRLRQSLEAIGCRITEGSFHTPWASMNTRAGAIIDSQGRCTQWDGKPVVFGFSVENKGEHVTRYGFTRDADGSLCLVGDDYALGFGRDTVQRAIENSYVNESVNEASEALADLGFFEDETQQEVQLQRLAS